jgi:phage terminase large subunit
MSLSREVDFEILQKLKNVKQKEVLQSKIHDELYFKKNSINLLVGKRGSGKTLNVIRQAMILSKLPDRGGYTAFILVSDKTDDATFNELSDGIDLKIVIVKYENAEKIITKLTTGKN